jgi:hypothetical protein
MQAAKYTYMNTHMVPSQAGAQQMLVPEAEVLG